MLESGKRADKNIMLLREQNMKQWKEEDYQFYEEFLEFLETPTEKDDGHIREKAWKKFQQAFNQSAPGS